MLFTASVIVSWMPVGLSGSQRTLGTPWSGTLIQEWLGAMAMDTSRRFLLSGWRRSAIRISTWITCWTGRASRFRFSLCRIFEEVRERLTSSFDVLTEVTKYAATRARVDVELLNDLASARDRRAPDFVRP